MGRGDNPRRPGPLRRWFFRAPVLMYRVGLGGLAGNRAGPYVVPDKVVRMLADVWAEVGRINVELRTIGPLVARSDVTELARVASVEPARDPTGRPAAAAAALLCGADTLVVLVLNHNLNTRPWPFAQTRALPRSNSQQRSRIDPAGFAPARAAGKTTLQTASHATARTADVDRLHRSGRYDAIFMASLPERTRIAALF